MFTIRVHPFQFVDNRLNAEANSPEFIKNAALIQSCGLQVTELGSLVAASINNSIRNVSEELDSGNGTIPMFRPADINGFWLDTNSVLRISAAFEEQHRKARVYPGDIVLAVAGTIGFAARVPPSVYFGNVNGSCARIKPSKGIDGYLLSYLNSRIGYLALIRLAVGSLQRRLNLEDLPSVPVVVPEELARTYIGDQVRLAERLRERARELEQAFQQAIQERYPELFGPIQAKGKHSRAIVQELDNNLNPGAYNPERLRIRCYLKDQGGKQIKNIATIETHTSTDYHLENLYIGLDAISSSSPMLTLSTVGASEVTGTARILCEGPAISKLRPYLNKVTYIPSELAGVLGSTELLCVKPKKSISGWFLYAVLKLESSVRQLNPVSTGATHPRVSREDVLDLIVPWLDESDALGEKLKRSQESYFSTERLTTAAKLLVEALIEGKVTEDELKTAQEALQRRDREPDQIILSRLTRKGIDIKGEPPLFPDLDALYDAIAQTASDDEEES